MHSATQLHVEWFVLLSFRNMSEQNATEHIDLQTSSRWWLQLGVRIVLIAEHQHALTKFHATVFVATDYTAHNTSERGKKDPWLSVLAKTRGWMNPQILGWHHDLARWERLTSKTFGSHIERYLVLFFPTSWPRFLWPSFAMANFRTCIVFRDFAVSHERRAKKTRLEKLIDSQSNRKSVATAIKIVDRNVILLIN